MDAARRCEPALALLCRSLRALLVSLARRLTSLPADDREGCSPALNGVRCFQCKRVLGPSGSRAYQMITGSVNDNPAATGKMRTAVLRGSAAHPSARPGATAAAVPLYAAAAAVGAVPVSGSIQARLLLLPERRLPSVRLAIGFAIGCAVGHAFRYAICCPIHQMRQSACRGG